MTAPMYYLTINCEAQEPGSTDDRAIWSMAKSAQSDDPENVYGMIGNGSYCECPRPVEEATT